jgi:hypothetical protein
MIDKKFFAIFDLCGAKQARLRCGAKQARLRCGAKQARLRSGLEKETLKHRQKLENLFSNTLGFEKKIESEL